jgi:hypothetical protein
MGGIAACTDQLIDKQLIALGIFLPAFSSGPA